MEGRERRCRIIPRVISGNEPFRRENMEGISEYLAREGEDTGKSSTRLSSIVREISQHAFIYIPAGRQGREFKERSNLARRFKLTERRSFCDASVRKPTARRMHREAIGARPNRIRERDAEFRIRSALFRRTDTRRCVRIACQEKAATPSPSTSLVTPSLSNGGTHILLMKTQNSTAIAK